MSFWELWDNCRVLRVSLLVVIDAKQHLNTAESIDLCSVSWLHLLAEESLPWEVIYSFLWLVMSFLEIVEPQTPNLSCIYLFPYNDSWTEAALNWFVSCTQKLSLFFLLTNDWQGNSAGDYASAKITNCHVRSLSFFVPETTSTTIQTDMLDRKPVP